MYTQSSHYWKEQDRVYWKRRPISKSVESDRWIGWRSNKPYTFVPSIMVDVWDGCTCMYVHLYIFGMGVSASVLRGSGFHHSLPLASLNHAIHHVKAVITRHYTEVPVHWHRSIQRLIQLKVDTEAPPCASGHRWCEMAVLKSLKCLCHIYTMVGSGKPSSLFCAGMSNTFKYLFLRQSYGRP